jgi:hypothetical protein
MPQEEGCTLQIHDRQLSSCESSRYHPLNLMQHSSAIRLQVSRKEHADVYVRIPPGLTAGHRSVEPCRGDGLAPEARREGSRDLGGVRRPVRKNHERPVDGLPRTRST